MLLLLLLLLLYYYYYYYYYYYTFIFQLRTSIDKRQTFFKIS
jgi:hypothetical protein